MDFISEINCRLNHIKIFVDRLKCQLEHKTFIMVTVLVNWLQNCSRLINATKEIQKQILDKCLTSNSSATDEQLDLIQPLIESCGQIWLDLWTELDAIKNNEGQTLREEVEGLLGQLINRTFIITQQPPRVLKTNKRFPATVRSLAGILLTPTTPVQAHILNETQARLVVSTFCAPQHLSTSGKLAYQETPLSRTLTGQTVANFQDILVKKIVRKEKKGQISVMEEKFAIAFTAEVKCGKLTFNLQIFSLPVVIIVHFLQERNAWATIVWDNNFGQPNRLPFDVPDKISRSECGQMLINVFFESTGCQLCPSDINFLLNKVSRSTASCSSINFDLSWSQFAKEPTPGIVYTFWEWFTSIVKLTHVHLTKFWATDCRLIYGFISRPEAEHRLRGKPDGTFLLRFSDFSLGSLSIVYTVTNHLNKQMVLHLAPFSTKDLTIRSLANRLNDFTNLRYLYPNLAKDDAFGAFYESNNEPTPQGYIKSGLVNKVPQLPIDQKSSTEVKCPTEVPDKKDEINDEVQPK